MKRIGIQQEFDEFLNKNETKKLFKLPVEDVYIDENREIYAIATSREIVDIVVNPNEDLNKLSKLQ